MLVFTVFRKWQDFTPNNHPVVKGASTSPDNPLSKVVNGALEGAQGSYSVAVIDLKNGSSYYLNEHKAYDSASLYKLWIMAETYKQIEEGQVSKDEVLSDDVSNLNSEFNIDPEYADLTEGTITLSVADALNQMITISHNYAALLLTQRIKISSVETFLTDNGFKESSVGDTPTTTAFDTALFFEKLYKGELGSPESTNEMITLLKNQQLNEKLPKDLPQGTVIAHKTGEIDYLSHDAGIVYSSKGDYIIAVLSDTDDPIGANDQIAKVSKAVYDYFQSK